jgi:tetratricopeptide (TPR) repeat protein
MRVSAGRVLIVAIACIAVLSGCETSTKLSGLLGGQSSEPAATAPTPDPAISAEPAATGSVAGAATVPADPVDGGTPNVLGKNPYDDLSLGKKYFQAANFGLAEKHFRRAVEQHPNDAESWVGLAASYDRLKRFDLADRAYGRAASILGETPEIMNNKGFSYLLRGDYVRARRTLMAAQARAPDNPYIRNNLRLLAKAERGKGVD